MLWSFLINRIWTWTKTLECLPESQHLENLPDFWTCRNSDQLEFNLLLSCYMILTSCFFQLHIRWAYFCRAEKAFYFIFIVKISLTNSHFEKSKDWANYCLLSSHIEIFVFSVIILCTVFYWFNCYFLVSFEKIGTQNTM